MTILFSQSANAPPPPSNIDTPQEREVVGYSTVAKLKVYVNTSGKIKDALYIDIEVLVALFYHGFGPECQGKAA